MNKILLVFVFVCSAFLFTQEKVSAITYSIRATSQEVWQEIGGENGGSTKKCGYFTGCAQAGRDTHIALSGLSLSDGLPIPDGAQVSVTRKGEGLSCMDGFSNATVTGQKIELTFGGSETKVGCRYSILVVYQSTDVSRDDMVRTYRLETAFAPEAQLECEEDQCSEELGTLSSSLYELCAQIKKDTNQYDSCMTCFTGQGIWTAIGCIPSNPQSIIQTIIVIGLALGGGIVLIMILAGSFMLSVSQGDPNKTKEAKEMITSAIIGLLFVIFSVTILQFIGVSILHIPGFGE